MDDSLISIIVPVYKVERYLPRCIESILRQTYTNFELILVDDGTPDRSGIICDRYAEKDSRIRVIHKENGGVSTARNVGIDVAKGEWITFVDSDDWVADDYLAILIAPLNDKKYDLTVGGIEYRYFSVVKRNIEERSINVMDINNEQTFNIMRKTEFSGPCFKLFSSSKIKDNNLRFPEDVAVAEDAIFVKKYLKVCNNIYVTRKTIYYYNRLNAFSVTMNNPYFKERTEWDAYFIETYIEMLVTFGAKEQLYKEEISQKSIGLFSMNARSVINSFNEEEAKKIIGNLIEHYSKWIDFELVTKEKNQIDPLTEYLMHKDVESIYNQFHTKQNYLILTIKVKIKRIFGALLEKHRDGLIKFKF